MNRARGELLGKFGVDVGVPVGRRSLAEIVVEGSMENIVDPKINER